jgi:DNA-binding XRE family transcriptional regulator
MVCSVQPMLNTTLVKQRRAELGLTLEQVGARVGVPRQTIQAWESGARRPANLPTLRAYARALGLSVADLVADDPEQEAAATP